MLTLNSEIIRLKGVGPALTAKLNNRGVKKIEDILFLLPRKYEDRTTLYHIQNAPNNERTLFGFFIVNSL